MRHYSRKIYVISGMGALAFVAITAIPHSPLLVWNISASAPLGLYMRMPEGRPARNDLVLIRPPVPIAEFAARRGYLPMNVPFIKRIVALTGDIICAHDNTIFLNGNSLVRLQQRDRQGRTLPRWSGCHTLSKDEIFLVMTRVSDSFDGRYFGPIPAATIEGRLVPLWTW